ncbi:hypothetical protein FE840_006900 [Peteryoungia desertarenae]|uniref:Uncharacterized protein n=1 Tax=Peteryoungia desertarenae TaxID=1813451 RepID=A0ABX6QSQ3_9HYPH|nr:hypothetical protein FE840_006900 [Peteryoungia desertarenae]
MVAGIVLGTPLVQAQEGAEPRFTLERTESGVIRLDRQTGAMALCTESGGNLACRMAADERAAYDEELSRLEKRVEALEKQLAQGLQSVPQAGELPSDAEIDRSIGIMERFMRAFFGLIQEFEKEEQQTQPDRTLTP